jgi:hypothetical protein
MNGYVLTGCRLRRLCAGQWKPTIYAHGADSGTLINLLNPLVQTTVMGRTIYYVKRMTAEEEEEDRKKRKRRQPDYDAIMGRTNR